MSTHYFKDFRIAANLSQKEAAAGLNVTPGALSSWEIGRYEPSTKTLCAMAELYHCTVDELLGRAVPEQKKPVPENPEDRLPPVETELLSLWRTMTEEQRVALVTAAFKIINKAPRDPE